MKSMFILFTAIFAPRCRTCSLNMAVAQPQAKRIDADLIADPFKQGIQSAVSALTEQGQAIPKLVGFLANTDPAAKKYAVWTEKAFKRDGLDFELRLVDELALEDMHPWRSGGALAHATRSLTTYHFLI